MPDVRLPYAACQGENEHACVIGPNEEILAECYDTPFESGMNLAMAISAMLNDRNDNHVCSAASADRARLFLQIVTLNGLRDHNTMAFVSEAIDEAPIKHVRDQSAQLAPEGPF
jgi:hypothetical protein